MTTKTRVALLAWLLAACGTSDQKPDERASSASPSEQKAAASSTCAAKAAQLEPWLAQLETETASHEIEMGGTLPTTDRAALPLSRHSDWITIGDSVAAYDATVKSVVGTDKPLARTEKALVERLTEMHATPPPADAEDATPAGQLRINVDSKVRWSDVVMVVNAAAKAGYTEALFAFGAKSKMSPPEGVDAVTTDQNVASQAHHALEALQEKCKPWSSAVFKHTFNPDRAANAKAVAKETASAIAECNCAADPDEVKKLTWQAERWHQAAIRTGVLVKLGGDGAVAIALPATTPWEKAHLKLLEAAPEGGAAPTVTLVTN